MSHDREKKLEHLDVSNNIIIRKLQQDYKATYSSNSSRIDPCVLDIMKIIRLNESEIDLIYFNRTESGLQILQRKPFISLDSIIFLIPVNNKVHMAYILVKALFSGRVVHVKQFCIESDVRTFFGMINNAIDRSIYSQLAYKIRRILYKSDSIKSLIQKILKF